MNLKDRLDLQSSIGLVIKSTEKSLERVLDLELRSQCGLTSGQWKVIVVLGLADGPTQKDLADLIFVESPTLVSILDKMEKDGLVMRRPDPKDRRTKRIFLTDKSKKMTTSIVDCILDFRKSITKGIPEKDIDTARKVLEAITHNTEKIAKTKHNLTLKNPHTRLYK